MPDPRRDTCRSCPATILWCRTAAGKMIPVDIDPHPGGNVALVGDDRCEVLGPEARRSHRGPLYRSHSVQFLCDEDARLAGPRTDRGSRSGGRTCDKGVCAQHAAEVGPDRHLCWDCNRERLKREKEAAGA